MWKYFSRGLRETFGRNIIFSRKDKATGQECNPIGCLQNKLIPGIVSSHNFDNGPTDIGGQSKNGPCNGKEKENKQQGQRWRENLYIQQNTIFEALGWSGVMVLGWYFCQPICWRRRTVPPDIDHIKSQSYAAKCQTEYMSLMTLLSRIVLAQPLRILPNKVVAPAPSAYNSPSAPSEHFVALSVDEVDGTDETEPHGPLTAEQALDKAAQDLGAAHKSVMSEVEHRLGMACMQLGKHKEAVTHFQKAVSLNYAPAAFNLGLCYETGLGTAQDLKLAAKYYELGSQLGHATAMYNLGVFHVRGWGGVPVDGDRARQLFTAAAKLGQPNAKEALAMIYEEKQIAAENRSNKQEAVVDEVKPTNVVHKSAENMNSRGETLPSIQQRQYNATEAFYKLLGIRDTLEKNEQTYSTIASSMIVENKDIAPVPLMC